MYPSFSVIGGSFSFHFWLVFSCSVFHGNRPQHPPSSPGNSDDIMPLSCVPRLKERLRYAMGSSTASREARPAFLVVQT